MKDLLLPPASLLLLALAGLLVSRRRPRAGRALAAAALLALVLLALPIVAAPLLRSLQIHPPLPPGADARGAQAIVVLAGDARRGAEEFGGATLGRLSLERARYAAALARATGLPVLTSGGVAHFRQPAMGRMLADFLGGELGVQVRWVEDASTDTLENARRSAGILGPAGVRRVLLVTHAWHMPRAAAAFEAAGLEVVPAPTGAREPQPAEPGAFVPSARALQESAWAVHEWIGRAWYSLRASG
jgi:uncharacterized SAM-binding protein YcdF (DUF218 family)